MKNKFYFVLDIYNIKSTISENRPKPKSYVVMYKLKWLLK